MQFVVADMNSHINQDLPLATVDSCVTAGTRPLAGTIFADYCKINEVLEEIEGKIRLSLMNELERELNEPVEPLVHLISSLDMVKAQEAAWVRVRVLWLLRDQRRLFDESVTSRHLLTPVMLGPLPRRRLIAVASRWSKLLGSRRVRDQDEGASAQG